MTLLDVENLTTCFHTYEGVVHALDKVSFAIKHGETFGLVGESGCGKSVTVQSIMGLVRPPGRVTDGRITFYPDAGKPDQGHDLLSLTEAQKQAFRGHRIAMIFQEPNAALDPVMTVGKQVAEVFFFHYMERLCHAVLAKLKSEPKAYGVIFSLLRPLYAQLLYHPKALWPAFLDRFPLIRRWRGPLWAEALLRAGDILEQLGISRPHDMLHCYPHELSGGMKQRVVIAMALAGEPALLIADEATSNLDVTIQAQIIELLMELKKSSLSALLFITHDLGLVSQICDRVGVMYAGVLCETGTVTELFKKPAHPYTRALLNSVPKLKGNQELKAILGSVPNLVTPPAGCRFHPRCPAADGICRQQKPAAINISPTHRAACHHIEKV